MLNIEYKDEELKLFIETGKSNDKRYKKLKSNAVFMRDLRMVINLMRPVDNVKELHMFKNSTTSLCIMITRAIQVYGLDSLPNIGSYLKNLKMESGYA